MNNFEQNNESPSQLFLDKIKEIAEDAPERIAEEYTDTANSWIACYRGLLTELNIYLDALSRYGSDSTTSYGLKKQFADLCKITNNLAQQYPDKNINPPPQIQEQLLNKLKYFVDNKPKKQAA